MTMRIVFWMQMQKVKYPNCIIVPANSFAARGYSKNRKMLEVIYSPRGAKYVVFESATAAQKRGK